MTYSSQAERNEFLGKFDVTRSLSTAPAFVLDIDGNIAIGYNLKDPSKPLTLGETDDSKTQNIPAGSNIPALVEQGVLEPVIFANKSRDVRLPVDLVESINRRLEAGDPFSITLLTSRNYADVEYILKESGVAHPEQVTVVADSGNHLHYAGTSQEVRTLSAPEQQFLKDVETLANGLNEAIRRKLELAGRDVTDLPGLFIEPKGAAINLHYRNLFNKYELSETEGLGAEIKEMIQAALAGHVNAPDAPKEADGRPVFKMGPGPMTFEVKLASVTKANGLQALVDVMKAQGRDPELVVFAGDDCYKNEKGADGAYVTKGHGTDWYAMKLANEGLEGKGFVIHTHHPIGNALDGTEPDPAKAIPSQDALDGSAPIKANLVVPTPMETGKMVVEAIQRMEKSLSQEQAAPGSMVMRLQQQQQQQQARAGGGGVGY